MTGTGYRSHVLQGVVVHDCTIQEVPHTSEPPLLDPEPRHIRLTGRQIGEYRYWNEQYGYERYRITIHGGGQGSLKEPDRD